MLINSKRVIRTLNDGVRQWGGRGDRGGRGGGHNGGRGGRGGGRGDQESNRGGPPDYWNQTVGNDDWSDRVHEGKVGPIVLPLLLFSANLSIVLPHQQAALLVVVLQLLVVVAVGGTDPLISIPTTAITAIDR